MTEGAAAWGRIASLLQDEWRARLAHARWRRSPPATRNRAVPNSCWNRQAEIRRTYAALRFHPELRYRDGNIRRWSPPSATTIGVQRPGLIRQPDARRSAASIAVRFGIPPTARRCSGEGIETVLSVVAAVPHRSGCALRRHRAAAGRRSRGTTRMARPRPNASRGAARGRASGHADRPRRQRDDLTPRQARAAHPLRGRERRRSGEQGRYGRRHHLKHEPKLREASACAQQHPDRPPANFRIGRDGTRDEVIATAPMAPHPRGRDRAGGTRGTRRGSLVIDPRPVRPCARTRSGMGVRGPRRSGQVGERQMGLLACRHGIHGDAFGPGYPLQSPVAALPAISASIPIASSRWRSLRATLARKAAMSAHRSGRTCQAQPPKGAVPGTNKYSSDVMDHCATRAHCANPASGGVLHSAALRSGRDSE